MANLASSYVTFDPNARIDSILQETNRYMRPYEPSGQIISKDIPNDLYVEEITVYKPILINEQVVHITSMRILGKDNAGRYSREYTRSTVNIETNNRTISCATFEVKSKLQDIFDKSRF